MKVKDLNFEPGKIIYNENFLLSRGFRGRRQENLMNVWDVLHRGGSLEDITPDNQIIKLFRHGDDIGMFRNGRFEFVAKDGTSELEGNVDLTFLRSMGYLSDNREVLSNTFLEVLKVQDMLGGYEGRYLEGLDVRDPQFDVLIDRAASENFNMPESGYGQDGDPINGIGPVFTQGGLQFVFKPYDYSLNNFNLELLYRRDKHQFGLVTLADGELHMLKDIVRETMSKEETTLFDELKGDTPNALFEDAKATTVATVGDGGINTALAEALKRAGLDKPQTIAADHDADTPQVPAPKSKMEEAVYHLTNVDGYVTDDSDYDRFHAKHEESNLHETLVKANETVLVEIDAGKMAEENLEKLKEETPHKPTMEEILRTARNSEAGLG